MTGYSRRSRLPRAAVALLSLSGVTGLALLPTVLLTPSRAVAAIQTEKEKRMFDAVVPAIDKAQEAEKRFGEKKWAEAVTAMDAAEKLYNDAYKRFPEAEEEITINLTRENLPTARKYGFVISESAAFAVQRYGIINGVVVVPTAGGRVRAADLREMLKAMRPIALVFSGKAVPFNNDGETQPNEVDVKDLYEKAFYRASGIELPVPDDQWEGVVAILNRCALMVEAARSANPGLEKEEIGDGRGHIVTGEAGRKLILAQLAEAEKEYKPAAGRLFAEAPAYVTNDLAHMIGDMSVVLERVNNGSYYDTEDAGVVGGNGRAAYFARLRKTYAEQYAKEAKTMPADVLKPLEAKIAEVSAALDRKAPGYTFTMKSPAPAGIAAVAKAAVLKQYPGATVVRVGMDDTAWAIFRTDLGIITGRTRNGRILFKMPGEKWHRSLLFTYVEDSSGGSNYIAPGRVGLGNILRFQSGR